MFPIGDTNIRGKGPGYLTIGLIIVNVLIFIFQLTMSLPQLEAFFYEYGVQPVEIVAGEDLHSLVTSMFLHGGWAHLIGNMLFLWVFGDNIEVTLGRILYPVFYLAGGFAASAAHIMVDTGSAIPSIGASGAIAAILGAYVVMFPRSQVKLAILSFFGFWITRVTAILFLGIWFVMQFFNGLASLGVPTEQTAGVAFWAHIGGFVFGLLVGFLARGRAKTMQYEQENAYRVRY